MNEHIAIVRIAGYSHSSNVKVNRRARAPVNVEVGNGAIAPKVAIVRRKSQPPVNVEVGNGAIAPKVAIARRKAVPQP